MTFFLVNYNPVIKYKLNTVWQISVALWFMIV